MVAAEQLSRQPAAAKAPPSALQRDSTHCQASHPTPHSGSAPVDVASYEECAHALAQDLGLVRAGVAAQHGVWVDVVGVVGAATDVVRGDQDLVKVLQQHNTGRGRLGVTRGWGVGREGDGASHILAAGLKSLSPRVAPASSTAPNSTLSKPAAVDRKPQTAAAPQQHAPPWPTRWAAGRQTW